MKKVVIELHSAEVYTGVYVLPIALDVGSETSCEVAKVIGCGPYTYVVEDSHDALHSYYRHGKDSSV